MHEEPLAIGREAVSGQLGLRPQSSERISGTGPNSPVVPASVRNWRFTNGVSA
ncbi:MAG: hypothetical protein WA954_01690 [Parerythrobacter sp.]